MRLKKLFKVYSLIICFLFFLSCNGLIDNPKQSESGLSAPGNFKVVGYMPSWSGDVNQIQYDKLTHINYAFILPTSSGGLTAVENPSKLTNLVSLGHSNGVKVLIAVGGWNDGNDSAFETLAGNTSYRTNFINNLINLVNTYNLDGVDIDWEYPDPWGSSAQNYATMMKELATALHSRGKLLTAAVVSLGNTGGGILTEVFGYVDFLNLMAYDGGDGPNHSPYSFAVDSLNYWLGRGLPASKAVLGVPFYGRPGWEPYRVIVARDPQAPYKDISGNAYYNGIDTIKAKTNLAMQRGGGIMMWELTQDTSDGTSLLKAINDAIGGISPFNVTITAPANGSVIAEGENVTITADASYPDGSIKQVEFFCNSTSLGVDTSTPYSVIWKNVQVGTYALTAVATNNEGKSATSAKVSIIVNSGGGCTTPQWDRVKVYVNGDKVHHNNHHWKAKWWTLGEEPGTTGQWGVWEDLGPCGSTPEDNQAPTVPTGLIKNSVTATSVTISWTASTDNVGVTGYKVFRNGSYVTSVATTSATIDGLSGNTTYSFSVSAYDAKGNESGQSAAIQITTDDPGTTPPTEWQPYTPYKVGDVVTYQGLTYTCIQAHTTLPGWEPPYVPALWKK